jgi:hypothetical protein
VAVVALGATAPALAADLGAAPRYTKAPAYVASIYNWTGFYIGGHLGGGFAGDNSILGSSRFLGGIQGGADYQFAPNWVAGIEAQYSWASNNNGSLLFPGGTHVSSNSDQLGSVTGRLGYTFGPALLYAKGRLCLEGWRSPRRDNRRRRSDRFHHQRQPSRWLHRRYRPRIPVRTELVGQGRIHVFSEAPPSSPRSASPAPGSTTMSMS